MGKKITAISLVILALLAAGLGAFAWYIDTYGEVRTVYEVNTGDLNGDVAVTMDIHPDGWQNSDKNSAALWGTQYDGELFNRTKQEIKDWAITFAVPKHSAINIWRLSITRPSSAARILKRPHRLLHRELPRKVW